MPSWTERVGKRFENAPGNMVSSFISYILQIVRSILRMAKKQFRIEFVDVVEQFAERARAVVEQLFAFFRGGLGGVADRAAFVQVLRLPGEGDRPMCREPAKFLLHRDAGGMKIRDRFFSYGVRIARQHDRCLDRAAMNAVTDFFRGEQSIRRAKARPARG